jgi:hypothetical protein
VAHSEASNNDTDDTRDDLLATLAAARELDPYIDPALADQYLARRREEQQRAAIAITADGLIAQINTVSIGGVLFAVGVLIVSLAMLGGVFAEGVAYLGIVTGPVGVVCESLRPVIGSWYGIYGMLLLVSWKLWRLSK